MSQPGITEDLTFTLDDALPVLGKPVEGTNNRKQVSPAGFAVLIFFLLSVLSLFTFKLLT